MTISHSFLFTHLVISSHGGVLFPCLITGIRHAVGIFGADFLGGVGVREYAAALVHCSHPRDLEGGGEEEGGLGGEPLVGRGGLSRRGGGLLCVRLAGKRRGSCM